ncbi:hypothetical protein JK354_18670 [Haloferax volcanii]|uniref:Uncharacterized protein n=1 Tax=Haloferax volcanii TaxID=2246 RepID=A0A8T5C5K4_HALVO|nr:hypothetical protein [Haloferax volcanii]MBS8121167.1 hypothetical protein [Haloferax volcanii]MBS8126177.1 hypothetical protein [Haloferax volcanii]MBS8130032.1 hypothetical protein [Haloferax volcanii]MBS8133896.1 hypothetical protein [Haloferax volcanii]MDW7539273.1 hypothetical protein [Haloferax volcanii]
MTEDAPPAVIYAKWATRLPNPEHAQAIQAVLYDENVGFDEERFEAFERWRAAADIPTVVYYIRDPLGNTYDRIKDEVDSTWMWTKSRLRKVCEWTRDGGATYQSLVDPETIPQCTVRETQLLKNKTSGQSYEPHVCNTGPVAEQFERVWSAYEDFQTVEGKIDERDLMLAKFYLRDTVSRFSRLVALLEQSNVYRANHGKATTLSGRIGALRQMHSDLTGDAQAGGGALQQAIYELEDLAELLNDPDNQAWKRGAVLSAMLQVTDNDEGLIIVAPDEPEAKALEADLYINRRKFWVEAEERVTICTPNSINIESPADHLLLYGPPKYEDRWILRSPHGANVSVLAYPHELGLLFSQASSLNHAVEAATPRQIPPEGPEDTGRILASIAEELPRTPLSAEEDRNKPPTVACSDLDGVQISIPDADSVEKGEISGSQTFKGHEQADQNKRDRVNSLIERSLAKFGQASGRYTPSSTGGGETSSSQSEWERRDVDGCIELIGQDGYRMANKPEKTVEVVRLDAEVRVSKEMSKVIEGEIVVSVRDRMEIRSHVERQLFDMGEAEVVVKANKWKDHLAREIERRGDTFEEFKQRIEQTGIEPKGDGAYRNWYHGTITMPKARDSLYYITEAYDLDEVQGELEVCWTANRTIRRVKNALINKWLDQAQADLLSKAADVDDLIDNDFDLDIRLSDFEKVDDEGEDLVLVHQIKEIRHGVTVPHSYLGTWRTP